MGSCFVGVLVMHAAFLLTRTTSALTTSVAGTVKSIAISLMGALAFSDYQYSLPNLAGLLISMGGAIWYAAIAGKAV